MRRAAAGLLLLLACDAGAELDDDDQAPAVQRVDDEGRIVLSADEVAVLDLATTAARSGAVTTERLRFGTVTARPEEDVLIVAPVTGRLVAPAVGLGDEVGVDDVVARIEPLVDTASRASMAAQLRELQGSIDAARAEVGAEAKNLARVSTLVVSGLATDADQAKAEASLRAREARAESLRLAKRELARADGVLRLRSPLEGVVAALDTDAGAVVAQGTTLARVIQRGPRWVDVAVPPSDAVGAAYRVRVGEARLDATLRARGMVVGGDGTRRDRLEVEADAAAVLEPGRVVEVEILDPAGGVLVPASAVVRHATDTLAFVEVSPGRFEPRPVDVLAKDEGEVVVSGVRAGEAVVERGAAALLGELLLHRRSVEAP